MIVRLHEALFSYYKHLFYIFEMAFFVNQVCTSIYGRPDFFLRDRNGLGNLALRIIY